MTQSDDGQKALPTDVVEIATRVFEAGSRSKRPESDGAAYEAATRLLEWHLTMALKLVRGK